ncbi:MAG: hypothetical protein HY298_22810 [Verrucomicrobia bacterium]|nr:hypothetical protein [Verrucomicrobiota bacterium]
MSDSARLAAGAVLAPVLVLNASASRRTVPLEDISFAAFAARVGGRFRVYDHAGAPVQLELAEARWRPSPGDPSAPIAEDAQNEKFALRFIGPPTRPLPQDTYWFEHADLGLFTMFIVPVGIQHRNYCDYEAIFNRPVTHDSGQRSSRHLR